MSEKKSFSKRVLDKVEVAGNKLPQPVTLFAILVGVVLILFWVFGGVSVLKPGTGGETGIDPGYITAENLLTKEGIQWIFPNIVAFFAQFPSLGLILVVMLGIGVTELTGMASVARWIMTWVTSVRL